MKLAFNQCVPKFYFLHKIFNDKSKKFNNLNNIKYYSTLFWVYVERSAFLWYTVVQYNFFVFFNEPLNCCFTGCFGRV